MSISRLWLFLAVALPVLAALIANLSSVDLTYHLRAGNEFLDTGRVPSVDRWTFTAAGLPWFDQQWGAQALLALVERIGGWTGLVPLRGIMVGFIFGSLGLIAWRRGVGPRTTALLVLAAFIVAAPALALRPQLFGMVCFSIVLLLVTDRRAHPERLWIVPIVVLAWANLHGSFFLGPLVMGLAWLEDVHDRVNGARRTLFLAAISAVAACVTPFGPMVWVYALGLAVNPDVTSRITEWQPTSLRDVPGILFFTSVVAVVVLIARRGQRSPWPTLLWLFIFFLIGTFAVRGVAWWPLAAAVAVSPMLVRSEAKSGTTRQEPQTLRRLNVAVAMTLIAAGVALLPLWRPIDPGLGTPVGVVGNAPPGITGALREMARPDDRLFNPQPWGSWFEYALPDLPVVLDSRIELFPPEVWDAYQIVESGVDGWERQLGDWGVTIVVVGVDQPAFVARLREIGWSEIHRDFDGSILQKPRG